MYETSKIPDYAAFIEETRVFWSKRAGRELTTEDAEEISDRLYEFTRILVNWDKKDKLRRIFTNQLHLLMQLKSQ
ncbi:MAG: hypothetical protein ACTSYJ_02415 [Candidatus Thorarchaeota archaeon]